MLTLRVVPSWLGNTKFRTKLSAAFFLLSLLVGGAGGAGLLFVRLIEGNVSAVSDVAAPLVTETVALANGLGEMQIVVLRALSSSDQAALGNDEGHLEAIDGAARDGLDRLRRLVPETAVGLDLEALSQIQAAYAQLSRQVIAARREQLTMAAAAAERLQSFEAQRRPLTTAMTELSSQGESHLGASEDRSRTLIQSGSATTENLGDLVAQLFTRSYPLVLGANKTLQFVVQLQDLARSYLTEPDAARLPEIERQFSQILRAAKSRLGRLERLGVETASAAQGLVRLETLTLAEDGLFSTYFPPIGNRSRPMPAPPPC